jgi:predicted nucleotide-binding protein
MDDMRSCAAAIVHVGTEMKVLDEEGKEFRMLNPNVLIEIGASMALYGRRFILLVEKGVTLPSNLQGLYEVRYEGSKLDYDATMKLLKAFNDFKN